MAKEILMFMIMFVVLVLIQVLICNHIVLFNLAIPMVFIYFIIRLPLSLSSNWLLTLAFLLGLSVDIFSDTPGLNALACTLLAGIKRPVFFAYVPRDDKTKEAEPNLATLGWIPYSKYLLTMTGTYCLLALGIEYFDFANVKSIVIMAVASTAITFLLLLAIDCIIVTGREKRL